jgi:hypothetical protein
MFGVGFAGSMYQLVNYGLVCSAFLFTLLLSAFPCLPTVPASLQAGFLPLLSTYWTGELIAAFLLMANRARSRNRARHSFGVVEDTCVPTMVCRACEIIRIIERDVLSLRVVEVMGYMPCVSVHCALTWRNPSQILIARQAGSCLRPSGIDLQ